MKVTLINRDREKQKGRDREDKEIRRVVTKKQKKR